MSQVSDTIIQAALRRFADYGPAKTSMAEIAKDCGMSVGNLYRHFENKHAMMMACLEKQLQDKLDAGLSAANQHEHALEALRDFLQTRLRIAHAQFADTRHLMDLFIAIESRHKHVLRAYEARVIAALADILRKGVQQGCFRAMDCTQVAYDIHQATLRYNLPMSVQQHTLADLSKDLDRLLDLFYHGLQAT